MSATTHDMLTRPQANTGSSTGRRPSLGQRVIRLFQTWRQRIEERDAFARLDDRDLHDMGLSRWEVETELAKPFWRG